MSGKTIDIEQLLMLHALVLAKTGVLGAIEGVFCGVFNSV
jgi:hypothetical protein